MSVPTFYHDVPSNIFRYPEVNMVSDLPDAQLHDGEIWVVLYDTNKGLYKSNGGAWLYLGASSDEDLSFDLVLMEASDTVIINDKPVATVTDVLVDPDYNMMVEGVV